VGLGRTKDSCLDLAFRNDADNRSKSKVVINDMKWSARNDVIANEDPFVR
jgi:hypothetical protein